MKHSTGPFTETERARLEKMMALGCICCAYLELWCPADECHHLLLGGKRMGHIYTIPLCRGHHQGKWRWEQIDAIPKDKLVGISSGRKRFNAAYPTERELWERVQNRLKLSIAWPESKILPRGIL